MYLVHMCLCLSCNTCASPRSPCSAAAFPTHFLLRPAQREMHAPYPNPYSTHCYKSLIDALFKDYLITRPKTYCYQSLINAAFKDHALATFSFPLWNPRGDMLHSPTHLLFECPCASTSDLTYHCILLPCFSMCQLPSTTASLDRLWAASTRPATGFLEPPTPCLLRVPSFL